VLDSWRLQLPRTWHRFASVVGGSRAKEDNHTRPNDKGDMLWDRTKRYLASVDFIDEAHLQAGFGDWVGIHTSTTSVFTQMLQERCTPACNVLCGAGAITGWTC
jgi:hypothetical protein